MAAYHVHFGAGKLGLGFVIPILSNLKVPIAIFQRPGSQDWGKLDKNNDVHFSVNSQPLLTCKYIADDCDMATLQQYLQRREHLFVSTSHVDLLQAVLRETYSFSTAVGAQGLSDVIAGIELLDSYPHDVRIYCFENDFKAVDEFRHHLAQTEPELTVISVMCDRICTAREITPDNHINTVTEKYPGNAVIFCSHHASCPPFTTPGSTRRRCTPSTVVLTHTAAEETFYYNRKFSLLNGIHYTMAVYAYASLSEDGVPPEKWLEAPLTTWKKNSKNLDDLNLLIEARILLLIHQTDMKTLSDIYKTSDKKEIFQELKSFSTVILSRIASTNDTAGRILNLPNHTAVKTKYGQHFQPLCQFLKKGDDLAYADFAPHTHCQYMKALNTWDSRIIGAALAHGLDLRSSTTPESTINNVAVLPPTIPLNTCRAEAKKMDTIPEISVTVAPVISSRRKMSAVELLQADKVVTRRRNSAIAAINALINAMPKDMASLSVDA